MLFSRPPRWQAIPMTLPTRFASSSMDRSMDSRRCVSRRPSSHARAARSDDSRSAKVRRIPANVSLAPSGRPRGSAKSKVAIDSDPGRRRPLARPQRFLKVESNADPCGPTLSPPRHRFACESTKSGTNLERRSITELMTTQFPVQCASVFSSSQKASASRLRYTVPSWTLPMVARLTARRNNERRAAEEHSNRRLDLRMRQTFGSG